jgi:hypothetical protein
MGAAPRQARRSPGRPRCRSGAQPRDAGAESRRVAHQLAHQRRQPHQLRRRQQRAQLVAHPGLERLHPELLPGRVPRLHRQVQVDHGLLEAEAVIEAGARPLGDHHVRVEQRVLLRHLLDEREARVGAMLRHDAVDDLRRLPARLEVRAQRQAEPCREHGVRDLHAAGVQDGLRAPGRREQHVDVGVGAGRRRVAPRRDQVVEPAVAVRHQPLGRQPLHLLAPADLALHVRAAHQDRVIVVVGVLAVRYVRAHQRVRHEHVVHRVHGSLQLEVVEVEDLRDQDVGVQVLAEPDAPEAAADAERADARRILPHRRVIGLGADVEDRVAERAGQVVEHRPEVVPVLAALGQEDDAPRGARQRAEGPVRPPFAEEAQSGRDCGAPPSVAGGFLRNSDLSLYHQVLIASPMVASRPTMAEMIRLPVLGSR